MSFAQLTADVTAGTGNATRVLDFSESEVVRSGRHEPVLRDAVAHGLTVAGTADGFRRASPAKDVRKRISYMVAGSTARIDETKLLLAV